jgi:hypothetical protein
MPADLTYQQRPLYFRQSDGALVLRPAGRLVNEDNLWGNCPLINYLLDPTFAVLFDEPFVTYDASNDWTLTQATAGSAAISTTVPGALTMDAGSSTANQGAQIQRLKSAFLPAANKSLWFEVTAVVGTALTGQFFLGLAASDTTIIAAGAMSTNNRIGWTGVAGDGVVQFDVDKAGVASQTTGVTLSLTVPHTLGFFYDGAADTVQQYIDGVAVGSVISTTNIPKAAAIYPSFVCQSSGTTQPTVTLSGLRVFQLR